MDAAQNSKLLAIERELRKVQLLFDISQILNAQLNVKEALHPVLKKMAEHMGMMRGTITILNRETGEVEIDAAYGLSSEEQSRGRYRLGEGVTGRVVDTGLPAVIERVSEEPQFLDRTRTRMREIERNKKEISFLCVPIKIGSNTIGAVSADRLFSEEVSLEENLQLLTIIASLLAQAINSRRQAREREQMLKDEKERLQGEILDRFKPGNIIGQSHAITRVYQMINQVASSNATVMIRGENGVGKELVAGAIHVNSKRADKPFVKVNLAALPENLLESELFGHERGAFTGAIAMRQGRFEMAHGGTLFLDEIGDLPPSTQVKLLRVLQEKEFERVGSSQSIKVDVRVISATNRNLESLIEAGQFRMDLYYRLNLFPIFVPPLRERKTDIMLLADFFVEKASRKHGQNILRISTPAIDMLMSYHWPGNIRELENCIERAVLLSTDGVIHSFHLPPSLQTAEASGTPPQGKLETALSALENEMIVDALKFTCGKVAPAARLLGISERLLGLRTRKHNITPSRYKVKSQRLN